MAAPVREVIRYTDGAPLPVPWHRSRCSERNLRTLDVLAHTAARTVLTGHGESWADGAEAIVRAARQAPVA